MATMKVTYLFKQGPGGWSESFYLDGVDGNPAASKDKANRLAILLASMLANPAPPQPPLYVQAYRIANVAVSNLSSLYPTDIDVRQANQDNPPAMCGTRTMTLSLYSADKLHGRKLGLRGLPSAWLLGLFSDRVAGFVFPAATRQVNALIAELKGGPGAGRWALRVESWIDPAQDSTIVDVFRDPTTGLWAVELAANDSLAIGQAVKIVGERGIGLQRFNGPTMISDATADPNTWLLNKRPCSTCNVSVTHVGRLQTYAGVSYPVITEAFVSGYGQHKTGSAFFRRRGRRRNKQCSL